MLKKPSFWLMALGFLSSWRWYLVSSLCQIKQRWMLPRKPKDQKFSIAVTDNSGLIKPEMLAAMNAKTVETRDQGVEKVRSGEIEAYFYYPKNLSEHSVEIYGTDVGIFENSRYTSVANMLLNQSVAVVSMPTSGRCSREA